MSHDEVAPGRPASPAPVSLPRRLCACFYDAVLLVAVWFLAAALLLPFTGGEAIPPGSVWFTFYLLGWALLYFLWPWVQGGQTLGMRAWRVRLKADGGGPVDWRAGVLRFFVALVSWAALGVGFWWALARRDRRAWHDIISETHLERV